MCGYGMWRQSGIAVLVILFINWIVKNIEIYQEKRSQDKEG
jgi:uncharacterized membrane protein YhiD involved in acid resistance